MHRLTPWLVLTLVLAVAPMGFTQTAAIDVFSITNVWKYQQTTNFDGVNWNTPGFDDSSWSAGPALLYVENNGAVTPRNTSLTLGRITYYFRTHFLFTNGSSGTSLIFSNLVDDGALFYLNGVEVQRLRMPAPPTTIGYATLATNAPPGGDATTYHVFTITGDPLTNLVRGDNVLAVEVHQQSPANNDIVFGTALSSFVYTGALTFVTQPTNVAVLDGRPSAFSTLAIADADPVYQWFKDGVAIPGATSRTYALAATYPSHAGTYFVQASNVSGTLASSNASLTVLDDLTAPTPFSATGLKDLTTIVIPFDEMPVPSAAGDATHYSVDRADSPGALQVLAAVLTNGTNVILTTTPRVDQFNYNVHVQGVHDISSRSNNVSVTLPLHFITDLAAIDGTSAWRFNDTGNQPPSNWATPDFDEMNWFEGFPLFYGGSGPQLMPEPVRTAIALTDVNGASRVLTHYFRYRFEFSGEINTAALRLRHIIDDGAIFYLNGQEFYSIRMSATRPVFATNAALSTVTDALYEPPLAQPGISIPLTNLIAGENVLAVEVHQRTSGTSDGAFGAAVEATIQQFLPRLRLQSPATFSESAGVSSNAGSVSVDSPLATNLMVSLISTAPSLLAVPAQVTIPAGATNVSFDISVTDDNLLNGARNVFAAAVAGGFAAGKRSIQVADNELAVLSLATPVLLTEGDPPAIASVMVSQAPSVGVAVSLFASNPALSLPVSVVIPAGATSAVFSVRVPNDRAINGNRTTLIRAESASWTPATASVEVRDNESTNLVLLLPPSAVEGDGLRPNVGEVRFGGFVLSNIVVTLTSGDGSSVGVPPTVIVPAGASNALFDVTFPDNALTDGTRNIPVTASAAGFFSGTNTISVFDNDPHHVTFSAIANPQYVGSNFALTAMVEDISGRRLSNFNGTISVSADSNTGPMPIVPPTIGPFTNGQWMGTVRIEAPGRMVLIRSLTWPGQSNPFHVEPPPVRVLNLLAQDLAYDPNSGAVFASVLASGGYTNKLAVIDPFSGTITNSYASAVAPGQLEISADGQFLYASVSNATALQRFDLGTRTFGTPLNFGSPGATTPDFAIVNGLVDTVVAWTGTLQMFSSGVRTPLSLGGLVYPAYLASSATTNIIYGFDGGPPSFSRMVRFSVNPISGLATADRIVSAPNPNFIESGGVIYAESGEAVDGNTLSVLGHYPGSGPVVVDQSRHRTIFLQYHGLANRSIEAYDRDTFVSLYRLTLPYAIFGSLSVNRFLSWGTNGFVIMFNGAQPAGGQIWFIQSNLLLPTTAPADLVLTHTQPAPPAFPGSNTLYTLTVSNQGPSTATLLRVTNALPSNVRLTAIVPSSGVVTQTTGVLWWNVDELPAGASATLNYSLVHSNAGWHHNYAMGASTEADLNFTNNSSHLTTFVQLPTAVTMPVSLDFPVEDVLYDASMDRLLLSLGNTGAPQSNGVAVMNPVNGIVESFTSLGTRPGKIARSDDGQFLYVSVPDLGGVRRLTLPNLSSNLQFILGGGSDINGQWDQTVAGDLEVMPNQPNVIAVSRIQVNEYDRGVAIFDNGILRSNATTTCSCPYALEFANEGTLSGSRGNGVIDKLVVDSNGVTLVQSATVAGSSPDLSAGAGLMYAAAGRVFDPQSLQYIGAFSGAATGVAVASDTANNRVFFIAPNGANWALLGYDTRTFSPIGTVLLANVVGTPASLVRWGVDGLAFRTSGGQLFLVRARMLDTGPTADLAVTQSRADSVVATNQFVTFTSIVTNVGAANATAVRFTNVLSGASRFTNVTTSSGSCALAGNTLTCDFGTLAAGQGVVVSVSALSSLNGAITSVASANTVDNETALTNNTALSLVQVGTTVGGLSVLPLNLPTLDLAWDATRGRLFATLGTNLPNWRDTLMSFDPETLAVGAVVPAGADANRVVVAPDTGEVYVGNYNAVQVFDAHSLSNISRFSIGLGPFGGPAQPLDIAAAPEVAGLVAVVRGLDVTAFDHGIPRTNRAGLNAAGNYRVAFGGTAADLFLLNDYLSGFTRMQVDTAGVSQVYNTTQLTPIFRTPGDLKFAEGLIYDNYGGVIDPAGPQLVATIPNIPSGALLTLDEAASRIFYLVPSGVTWNVQAYELRTLLPAGVFPISGVNGTPTSLTRWGSNGFAFRTSAGQLFLVRSPLVSTGLLADLALTFTPLLQAQFLGSNFTITVTASNRGPGDASNVVMGLLLPAGGTIVTASVPYIAYSSGLPALKFDIGALTNGASTNITITFHANAAGLLRISAVLMANADDANQSNNFAAVNVPVAFPPDWTGLNFLSLPARDTAYDRGRNVLYVSSGGDTVAVVSPDTGDILESLSVGPLTGRLRITENGEFLYVSVSNGNAFARIELTSGTRDLLFGSPYATIDFEPLPGAPHSIITSGFSQLIVYDDGVARPEHMVDSAGAAHLEFADATDRAYANGRALSSYRRYRTLQITATGVQEIAWNEGVPNNLGDFEFLGGLFYATTGDILAPATGAVVGHINGLGSGTLVEPDSTSGRVYFVSQISGEWRLLSFDTAEQAIVSSNVLSGVFGTPQNLVRCGPNTLAFNTSSNQIVFIRPTVDIDLKQTAPTNPVVLANLAFALQWRLSNAGLSTTAVVVSNRLPAFATFVTGSVSYGSVSFTNGAIMWTVPALDNSISAFAGWQLQFTNTVDLVITNIAIAIPLLPDPNPVNNSVASALMVLADNDQNRVGDTWELHNFGGLGVAPDGNPDNDGFSNLQEFNNGTDPSDASNALRIVRFTLGTNISSLTFFATRGHDYAIETSPSLSGPWVEVFSLSGASERVTWTEMRSGNNAFYRVRKKF